MKRVAVALLALVVGVGCDSAHHAARRLPTPITTVGTVAPPSTSTEAPPRSTVFTAAPVRTLPWVSTMVEPNTRDPFIHTLDAAGVHDAPRCTLDDLFVRATFGGAGGTEYAGIKVRNRAAHPCFVQGSPNIRFLDTRGRDLGGYAPQLRTTDLQVVLVPSSWAAVGLTPIGPDHCGGPNNDAQAGITTAAILFGLDAAEARVVRSDGDQPTANGCPPVPLSHLSNGAFEVIPIDVALDLTYAPLHDGVTLEPPLRVRRGETATYTITITNTSNSFPLVGDGCPLYRQTLDALTSSALLLNCTRPGLIIAPSTAVRFEMRLTVPPDQPLGATTLRWQFVEPEEPALSAQITVIDRTHSTPP